MMLHLRPAVEADAERVFPWRNDPAVRGASLDPREIAWEDHRAWFRTTLERADRRLLVAESEGVAVGVLRFDLDGMQAEISIYLDPAKIGRGLGTAVLLAGVEWAKRNLSGVRALTARVRPDNPVSLKVFEKAGFAESWRVYDLKL